MSPWWRRARGSKPDADLTTCRSCASDSVTPTAWTHHDEESWRIRVRCGECEESREIVVSDAAARRYDRGMHKIARALERLEREEMARDAEAFVTALELDLYDADDFVR